MNGTKLELSPYSDFVAISEQVLDLVASKDAIGSVHEFLTAIAETARDFEWYDLHDAACLYASLVHLATCSRGDEEVLSDRESAELSTSIMDGVRELRLAMSDGIDAVADMQRAVEAAKQRWGAYIELLGESGTDCEFVPAIPDRDSSTADFASSVADVPHDEVPSADEVSRILTALSDVDEQTHDRGATSESKTASSVVRVESPAVSPVDIDDAELAEAFLDDACRCITSMEDSLLAFEDDPTDYGQLRQLCRDLHTLKGASASVGLTELSDFLHRVEDDIQSCCDGISPAPDIDVILQCVDTVRKQIEVLRRTGAESDDLAVTNSEARPDKNPAPATHFDESPQEVEQSIRVKAAQLDRLMDMLSELVMLRNERDSRLEGFKSCYGELVRCVPRIRASNTVNGPPKGRAVDLACNAEFVSSPLREVADDVAEIAHSLRDAYEPLVTGNLAISRIIGQFRQELVELRRVPIAGLFRRLQRSIRDAARVEGKQVRLRLVGEQAGIDRSLQERLYEPLLHIVRNAVSHGIEDTAERIASGKEAVGTVTLEARSGANFLVIEVGDDGKGLDYDALRRRGTELGLLQGDRPATRDELAQLIFHPGFSTRNSATEISGRGVGMDVVATALERMRSWLEVESTPGFGTTVRLTIPLPSVIEHVMVFRSGGQLFAIPMKFVHSARKCDSGLVANEEVGDSLLVRFNDLFSEKRTDRNANEARLVIGYRDVSSETHDHRVTLTVEEIVGPDEVVMRAMPSLLKHHSLYSGVTLAGTGEIVLVFDTLQLIELSQRVGAENDGSTISGQQRESTDSTKKTPRALVVDDSVSARVAISQMLVSHEFEITEAADGLEAVDHLRKGNFALVVSDLEMPRLGGLDLLERIRAEKSLAELPVILASSRDDEEFRLRAGDLGAVAYLTKPVNEDTLAEALAACIRG